MKQICSYTIDIAPHDTHLICLELRFRSSPIGVSCCTDLLKMNALRGNERVEHLKNDIFAAVQLKTTFKKMNRSYYSKVQNRQDIFLLPCSIRDIASIRRPVKPISSSHVTLSSPKLFGLINHSSVRSLRIAIRHSRILFYQMDADLRVISPSGA